MVYSYDNSYVDVIWLCLMMAGIMAFVIYGSGSSGDDHDGNDPIDLGLWW